MQYAAALERTYSRRANHLAKIVQLRIARCAVAVEALGCESVSLACDVWFDMAQGAHSRATVFIPLPMFFVHLPLTILSNRARLGGQASILKQARNAPGTRLRRHISHKRYKVGISGLPAPNLVCNGLWARRKAIHKADIGTGAKWVAKLARQVDPTLLELAQEARQPLVGHQVVVVSHESS
jgi:hypothetical protein